MRPRRFDATASSAGSGWPRRAWLDVTHSAALALIPFRPRGRAPDADGKASPAGSRSFLRRPVRIPGLVSCSGTGPSSERRGDASGRPPGTCCVGADCTGASDRRSACARERRARRRGSRSRHCRTGHRRRRPRSPGCLFHSGRCPQALASEAIPEFRPASRPGTFGADAWAAKTVLGIGWRSGDRHNAFQGFVQAERRIDRQPLAHPSLVRVQRRIRLDGAQGVRLHAGSPLRRRGLRISEQDRRRR